MINDYSIITEVLIVEKVKRKSKIMKIYIKKKYKILINLNVKRNLVFNKGYK